RNGEACNGGGVHQRRQEWRGCRSQMSGKGDFVLSEIRGELSLSAGSDESRKRKRRGYYFDVAGEELPVPHQQCEIRQQGRFDQSDSENQFRHDYDRPVFLSKQCVYEG